jgi:hypothetical protein
VLVVMDPARGVRQALSPLAARRYRFQAIPPEGLLSEGLLSAGDWPAAKLASGGPPGGP